jgi:hypothetical protein
MPNPPFGLPATLDSAIEVWKHRNLTKEQRAQFKDKKLIRIAYPYQPMGNYIGSPRATGSRPWYPHPHEVRPCCWDVKATSVNFFTWTWHNHCRTARHVAHLFDVSEVELRRHVGIKSAPSHCSCGRFRPKADYLCGKCREKFLDTEILDK